MDLNSINLNVNRLLQNIWAVITFLKEFTIDGAKDVSITYINADGSESVKTFSNLAKQMGDLEIWKKDLKLQVKSLPKFCVVKAYKDAEFGDFTNWSAPYCTIEVIGEIISGINWENRSAFDKEWLKAIGLEGIMHFYPSSFKVYRLTSPASREGHCFPYIATPLSLECGVTVAAYVRYIKGALPFKYWCEGLTKSGKIELCGSTISSEKGYLHCHPFKNAGVEDTVIEVALAGAVDTYIDLTKKGSWLMSLGKVVY